MRRDLVAMLASVVLLVAPVAAWGGDYHSGAELVCAECHVMHYSQSHGYEPDGSGEFVDLADGPHEYLLRNDVNSLCLACHDGDADIPRRDLRDDAGPLRQHRADDGSDPQVRPRPIDQIGRPAEGRNHALEDLRGAARGDRRIDPLACLRLARGELAEKKHLRAEGDGDGVKARFPARAGQVVDRVGDLDGVAGR